MNTKLPLDLFNQAKRSASQDQPALFSWVTELDELVSPVKLFKKLVRLLKVNVFSGKIQK